MDTPWLLVLFARPKVWLCFVERLGFGTEKTEGVEMGATERARFDERIDFVLRQTEWDRFAMTNFSTTIYHGPFVETVAGEVGWSRLCAAKKVSDVLEALLFFFRKDVRV